MSGDGPARATVGDSHGWGVIVILAVALVVGLLLWGPVLGPSVNEGEFVTIPGINDVYDPVAAGEPLPDGYRRVTNRDRIRPIYSPRFLNAEDTDWTADTLVIGVAVEGEAKAYPVHILNSREMVLDRLGGTPILASW